MFIENKNMNDMTSVGEIYISINLKHMYAWMYMYNFDQDKFTTHREIEKKQHN